MSIIIRDNTASFQATARGMAFPIDSTGLEVLSVFGGSLDASCRNFSAGKPSLVTVGAPAINANSVVVGNNQDDYFQTSMTDTGGDTTLCLIVKPVSESDVMGISNYGSSSQVHAGTTVGAGLYGQAGTAGDGKEGWTLSRAKWDGSTSIAINASLDNSTPVTSFSFLCGRFDAAAGVRYLDNLSTTASAISPIDIVTYDTGQPFRIGASYASSGFAGEIEVVAAIGMSRKISDDEMQTLYEFWQGYCERRSISI